MSDYIIRPWKSGDEPALRALMEIAFGDGEAFIDPFFAAYLKPGGCIVAEVGGEVVSAMYILPGQTLRPYRTNTLRAGYAYALATLPAWRGQGIGAAVYRAVCGEILRKNDAACVLPSEEGLYPFYEKANGAKPLSAVREARLTRADLSGAAAASAVRFPAFRYAGIRESFLSGLPHASYGEELFDLMEETGCEFFLMEDGLAAAETADGICRIRELIAPDADGLGAVAAIARWCPAEEYIVRTPLFFKGPGQARPFVLGVLKETPDYPIPNDLWWPFGLE